MRHKHNPELTKYARELRKNMTREERHLWYDFLKDHPLRFLPSRASSVLTHLKEIHS